MFDDDSDSYGRYSHGRWRRPRELGPEPDADLGRQRPPRTRQSHPYSYDPFTIWGKPYPNDKCNGSDYTDRLEQWDYKKYRELADRLYANQSVFNSYNCKGELIEEFLRAYYGDPELKLLRVIAYCNLATGYPLWRLDYVKGAKPSATCPTPSIAQKKTPKRKAAK